MNQYKEKPLGAYTIGDMDWEFGQFLETGAYYVKSIDFPSVHKLIQADSRREASQIADEFISKFVD